MSPTGSAMKAVVFEHEAHEGPAMLGEALEAAGFQVVRRFRAMKAEDRRAELVVVMGGSMGVYEAERHPFLSAELALVAERLALGLPVLGICLGAQLLAAAAGAQVFPGKNGFEVGVGPVVWTKAATEDLVIAPAGPKGVVAHWHADTHEPVPGAVLLASTARYSQQAFRLGPSYGFQFHLELTAAQLDEWLTQGEAELSEKGQQVAELRKGLGKLRAAEAENRRLLERLAQHYKRDAAARK